MKKKSIIKIMSMVLVLLTSISTRSAATIFPVSVGNNFFSPNNILNVQVGDTIEWDWAAGFHTTTCDPSVEPTTSLPSGALTWDAAINNISAPTNHVFQYKVLVEGIYNYICSVHGIAMSASFTATSVLPVKLSLFKVSNENNHAFLNWRTESEDNIDYFSIQKSKTGSDFTEIARVPAAGHSSDTRNYNYTDPDVSSQDKYFYYAIAAMDKDGKKQFSPIQLFKNNLNINKLILSISPNPINRSGHLMLRFNADKPSKMEVKVLNMLGESIMETTLQANEGVNNEHLMLGDIPAGSYSISFELNGIKEVHKIIVK